MKTLFLDKPCVLRLLPDIDGNCPTITVFDSEEDAILFWKEEFGTVDPIEGGYNDLHRNGKVNIEYFDSVNIRHWSHNDLQDFLDKCYKHWIEKLYADWCIKVNDNLMNQYNYNMYPEPSDDEEWKDYILEMADYINHSGGC